MTIITFSRGAAAGVNNPGPQLGPAAGPQLGPAAAAACLQLQTVAVSGVRSVSTVAWHPTSAKHS